MFLIIRRWRGFPCIPISPKGALAAVCWGELALEAASGAADPTLERQADIVCEIGFAAIDDDYFAAELVIASRLVADLSRSAEGVGMLPARALADVVLDAIDSLESRLATLERMRPALPTGGGRRLRRAA